MDSAAANVSVGAVPAGPAAAAYSLPHASGAARAIQPASASAKVAKFAIVGVWLLLSGSWIVPPQPPVARSTKLGTLPAAIFSCSGWPLIAVPSMNWLCVHTDATVVISLIVTVVDGFAPTTPISAMAGLSPPDLLVAGVPPFATKYRVASRGGSAVAATVKRPSAPVRA